MLPAECDALYRRLEKVNVYLRATRHKLTRTAYRNRVATVEYGAMFAHCMLRDNIERCEHHAPWDALPPGMVWAIGLTNPELMDRAPAIVYSALLPISKGRTPSEALEAIEFEAGLERVAEVADLLG